MKEIVLFSSDKCPHCPPVVEKLDKEDLDYRLVNITNSMAELKEFLRHRDSDPHFDKIKAQGLAGVPSLMVDGRFVDVKEFLADL